MEFRLVRLPKVFVPELACKSSQLQCCKANRDSDEREPSTAFAQNVRCLLGLYAFKSKSFSACVLYNTCLQTRLLPLFARLAHIVGAARV
jgi:hypothetical protein